MARSTASAEAMLTSCSAERPPAKMPTRSRSVTLPRLVEGAGRPIADELDLVLQVDAEPLGDGPAHVIPDGAHVGGSPGPPVGDDEVRVQRAHLGRADAMALQAGGVDEPPGMVAGRVAEDAARVLVGQWLRRLALRLVLGDARGDRLRLPALQLDGGGQHHLARVLETRLTVR